MHKFVIDLKSEKNEHEDPLIKVLIGHLNHHQMFFTNHCFLKKIMNSLVTLDLRTLRLTSERLLRNRYRGCIFASANR